MEIKQTSIPGCYEILPRILKDERGHFVKTFHTEMYRSLGLETVFQEEYYSYSRRNVLRGLHFQLPPHDHTKIVYCVLGQAMDVVVDLRVGSPTYGQFETFEVSDTKANLIYIPTGLAHGFYVQSEQALMVYKTSTMYAAEYDTGILWNSADIPWPCQNPIISSRDSSFATLREFESPFHFQKLVAPKALLTKSLV